MKKKYKTLLKVFVLAAAALALVLALVVGLWFWSSSSEPEVSAPMAVDSDIILFFGKGCSHCKELDKFIEENKISEKISFNSLEVWFNAENKKIFADKALECGIPEKEMGVPFLASQGKCYIGTPDIEKFFKQEAGIQ